MATSAKATSQQLSALTWNVEGIKKNIFPLAEVLNSKKSSLVFLSEPQVYQCDIASIAQYIDHDYCFSLNSEDDMDPELPLLKSKAKGGTMVLWRKWLDPHIKVIPVTTASFLPLVLTLPGYQPSVHVAVYLPTHGQDTEFVSELANLRNCLDELVTTYSNPCIYIRGDANVNAKNTTRVKIMQSFKQHFNLTETNIEHKTYHHFVGDGKFDSNVDVILHTADSSNPQVYPECVTSIICQKDTPSISSHHDLILSSFSLPPAMPEASSSELVAAPRLSLQRNKIEWSEEGVAEYESIVSKQLRRIRDTWLVPNCQASMSVLLQLSNTILSKAALATNEGRTLERKTSLKKKKVPHLILKAKPRF